MSFAVRDPIALPLTESSQVGDARRTVAALADRLGFDETRRAEVAIVATELGNNLIRHGRGGEMVFRSIRRDDVMGVELLAIDKGPGIAHLGQALQDGYSTGGTQGTGLGAVRRLSPEFDVYSADRPPGPGGGTGAAVGGAAVGGAAIGGATGTAVVARLWAHDRPRPLPVPGIPGGPALECGVVCLPKAGEEACGDAYVVLDQRPGRTLVMVSDGLGHGFDAAQASRQAVRLFHENAGLEPARIMDALHAGLRSTRGAAVAIADLRLDRRQVRFVGVGNISAVILPPAGEARPQSLTSHNGTVGAEARRVQEFVYPWPAGGLLVMHSDGLASQWQLPHYPGLRNKHPALVAAVLYRDHRRVRDDVTVLAAREN